MLAVSALAVLIVGGTALAATKRCPADCFGTKKADTLVGNAQGHDFFGRAGSDVVRARGGEDNLYGQAGADRLLAGPEVKTADGRNRISWEGSPIEYAVGGDGNDEISGDENGGRIVGGSGDDRIFANGGDDEVLAHGDGGGDTVDCGEGLDEVYYDPGDQVYANCEDKTPVN